MRLQTQGSTTGLRPHPSADRWVEHSDVALPLRKTPSWLLRRGVSTRPACVTSRPTPDLARPAASCCRRRWASCTARHRRRPRRAPRRSHAGPRSVATSCSPPRGAAGWARSSRPTIPSWTARSRSSCCPPSRELRRARALPREAQAIARLRSDLVGIPDRGRSTPFVAPWSSSRARPCRLLAELPRAARDPTVFLSGPG